MKGLIVIGTCFVVCMLMMVPSIAAVEWNECEQSFEDLAADSLEEKITSLLETNEYPILTKILISILSNIVSKVLGRITQNKALLGIILQLLWFMFVRNYLTPMLTASE